MRISRDIEKWGWYKDTNTFRVFFHLLLKAQYQQGEFLGISLVRGQVVTGRKQLSSDLGLSEQNVRTALDHLQKSGEITIKPTNKFSIVTICKYDSWVCEENESNQQLTNNQPTTNHIKINNEGINIEDNIDNINNIPTTEQKKNKKEKVKKEKDEQFEVVWLAYNKKGSKKDSLEQWEKLSDEEKERVLPHVRVYVSSRDRSFTKDFQRYLRDKIFNDVIVKGNDTIYDPEQFANKEEYHPMTDGIFQFWNADRKCLMFNGYIDQLNDGYTDDTRPDGAKVAWSMYEWIWSSQKKQWIKQND